MIVTRLDTSHPDLCPGWEGPRGAPVRWLRCDAATGVTSLHDASGALRHWNDPLAALAWMAGDFGDSPHHDARWVGFIGYDLGRRFEDLPARAGDDLNTPLFAFTLWDGQGKPPHLPPARHPTGRHRTSRQPVRSNFSRQKYLRAAHRALEYIRAGDVFQVNLSQRFSAGLREPPATIYERLRRQWPARYGALLDGGDYALVCNSPELFLRVEPDPRAGRRRVITRPIKGTRPRAPTMEEELRDSEKDAAELNMIVDLERNDLGRVCEIGSVRVIEPRTIEAHPTVYHGVATIEGDLRDDVNLVDLLRATFPGGSVTGAPKIRAMQIIDELEPNRRGPYCGAIGYVAADGATQFALAIRTMTIKEGLVHIPVGGGIVADSDPAGEYEETLVKAKAMFAALGIAAGDIR